MKTIGTGALLRWCLRGKSLLRGCFHESLRSLPEINGVVLDVGGTREPVPTYMELLRLDPKVALKVVNIDKAARPDIVADASAMPFDAASFDTVLCFNVLEHVADPQKVLMEMARVLKHGGTLILETPFLVKVHGHPEDYHRFTSTALERMAEHAGLSVAETRILGGGPFLAGAAQVQPVVPRLLFVPCLLLAQFCDWIIRRLRPRFMTGWPLGYLLVCERR